MVEVTQEPSTHKDKKEHDVIILLASIVTQEPTFTPQTSQHEGFAGNPQEPIAESSITRAWHTYASWMSTHTANITQ